MHDWNSVLPYFINEKEPLPKEIHDFLIDGDYFLTKANNLLIHKFKKDYILKLSKKILERILILFLDQFDN